MKRVAESIADSRFSSTLTQLRPSSSATQPVVLEPENMSSTESPGSLRNLMKKRGKSAGNRAGWLSLPRSLQTRRQWELLSVFGIWSKFEGIAPAFFLPNDSAMSCPEGRILGL